MVKAGDGVWLIDKDGKRVAGVLDEDRKAVPVVKKKATKKTSTKRAT